MSVQILSLIAEKSPSVVESVLDLAKSNEGAIVRKLFHDESLSAVDLIVDGFLQVEQKRAPDQTADQLIETVSDDCWHYLRHKLGFFGGIVDVLRNVPSYESAVRDLIKSRIVVTPDSPTKSIPQSIAQTVAPVLAGASQIVEAVAEQAVQKTIQKTVENTLQNAVQKVEQDVLGHPTPPPAPQGQTGGAS